MNISSILLITLAAGSACYGQTVWCPGSSANGSGSGRVTVFDGCATDSVSVSINGIDMMDRDTASPVCGGDPPPPSYWAGGFVQVETSLLDPLRAGCAADVLVSMIEGNGPVSTSGEGSASALTTTSYRFPTRVLVSGSFIGSGDSDGNNEFTVSYIVERPPFAGSSRVVDERTWSFQNADFATDTYAFSIVVLPESVTGGVVEENLRCATLVSAQANGQSPDRFIGAEMTSVLDVEAIDTCPANYDGDGDVDLNDYSTYLNLWLAGAAQADLTTDGAGRSNPGFGVADGIVAVSDFDFFLSMWLLSTGDCPCD